MADVIKRDGSRQAFSEKKVRNSIEAAAREAKVPDPRIKQVVADAAREPLSLSKGKQPIETKIIREKILSRLDSIEPKAAEAWRAFDSRRR